MRPATFFSFIKLSNSRIKNDKGRIRPILFNLKRVYFIYLEDTEAVVKAEKIG